MARFRRKTQYEDPRHDVPPEYGEKKPGPTEQPVGAESRETITAGPTEQPISAPKEAPRSTPDEICGIGGCKTCYDDPVVMARHKQRCHGVEPTDTTNDPDATRSTKTLVEIQNDIVNQAVNHSR